MSTTQVHAIHDSVGHGEYLEYGRDDIRAKHLKAGTNRLAAMRSSLGSVGEFAQHAQMTAQRFARTIHAQSYTQSFHPDTFDVTNPEHIKRVNELGCELAERMHPNSHYVVVTHADAAGKNLHNHIDVENHDHSTGRALTRYRMHREVTWANDQLMREHGLPVLEVSPDERRTTQADYWATRRGQLIEGEVSFDVWLGDQIEEAMLAPNVWNIDDLKTELATRGITMTTREAGRNTQPGITYSAIDEIGPKRRPRRRKASKLSGEFTHDGLTEFFTYKTKEFHHERQGQTDPHNEFDLESEVSLEPDFDFDLTRLAAPNDGREQRNVDEDSYRPGSRPPQPRNAAEQSKRVESQGDGSEQSDQPGGNDVDLAAARHLLAAARERDERDRRDEENAERDRLDRERLTRSQTRRWFNSDDQRFGRTQTNRADPEEDHGADFG